MMLHILLLSANSNQLSLLSDYLSVSLSPNSVVSTEDMYF